MSRSGACTQVEPLLETFADGELSAESTLTVEQHLNGCAHCSATVEGAGALKQHLRAAVHAQAVVTPEFMAHMQSALAVEDAQAADDQRAQQRGLWRMGAHLGPLSWRTVVPLVAAACTLLWVSMKQRAPMPVASNSEPKIQQASTNDPLLLDEAIDELIDYHSAPPASQLTERTLVPQMERDVGVRVHLPDFDVVRWSNGKLPQAQGVPEWQGAAVVPVRNHRAAYLRYNVGGHWVTLYVYNSGRFPVHNNLEQRVVRDMPVYVGERRGYSIAARERKGIGYAVATDFNDVESAELVAAIH